MDNKITVLRKLMRLTQRGFSEFFGIPVGTIRNWEQGIATPPSYIYTMMKKIVSGGNMINVTTVKFISMLNCLAELSKNGIDEFSNANEDNHNQKIFYNKKKADEKGNYYVVQDSCIIDNADCYHHDVISYYGDDGNCFVSAVIDDDNKAYIDVTFPGTAGSVVIEDGRWYFTE